MKKIFTAIIFISALSFAQDSTSFIKENFKVTGEAGVFGELYSISGQPRRRPPSSYRLYVRPTFTLFNMFTIPLNLFISSEGSKARQEINRYGITPQWDWGRAYVGDFSESYSEFSLGEINIRGAGFNINPGIFRVASIAGFTSRSVEGGALNGSYDRFIAGAKLGIGLEESNYLDLIFLKAKDKPSSKKTNDFIQVLFPNGSDEIPINTVQTIRWNNSGFVGDVKIEISRDGGSTYTVVTPATPNTGAYSWLVNEIENFNAKIRITSISKPEVSDESDYSFRLYNGNILVEGNIPVEVVNPLAIAPQENLILGTKGQLSLFDDRIKLNIDASGSAYSKDITAEAINLDSVNIPSWIKNIYSPRISTNIDYAYSTVIKASFQPVDVSVGYKRIGPGYNSLGLPYIMNDQQELTTAVSLGFSPYFFMINYSRVNDNLLSQKLFTTARNNFGFMASGQILENWNSSIMTNILDMGNNSSNDTTKMKFNTFMLSFNNMVNVNYGMLSSVSLTYSFQKSNNETMLSKNAQSKVNNINAGINFNLLENLNGGMNLGFMNSQYAGINNNTQVYGIFFSHMEFDNKLNTNLNLNYSKQKENSIFGTVLSSTYRLTNNNSISLSLSYNGYNAIMQKFTELRTNLNLRHTF